jgi:acetate kinase
MYGKSADIRDVFAAASAQGGDPERLNLTTQVYLWRLRKYLGAYLAVVGLAHAVIFTDTIGETVPLVRWSVCTNMETFGLQIDAQRNAKARALPADVATDRSRARILVIQTNEELAIARRAHALLSEAA